MELRASPALYQFREASGHNQVRVRSDILIGFRRMSVSRMKFSVPLRAAEPSWAPNEHGNRIIAIAGEAFSLSFPEPSARPLRTNA